jgi:hypothetical protein
MAATTKKLTIRLPESDIEAARRYAKRRGITVTHLVHRLLESLEKVDHEAEYPSLEGIAGIIPETAEICDEHSDYLESKHR